MLLTACFVIAPIWFALFVGKTHSIKFGKVISQTTFANESNNWGTLSVKYNDSKIEKITINISNEMFPSKHVRWLVDKIFLSQNDKDIVSLAACPYHLTEIAQNTDNLYAYFNSYINSFVANKQKLISYEFKTLQYK